MTLRQSFALAALLAGLAIVPAVADAPPLTAQKPIAVPGGPGGFDWMTVDAPLRRLIASHKGTHSTAVLDLSTETVLPAVPTGNAQGVAVDPQDGKVFAGDDDEKKVVVLDRKTLAKTGEIPVTGPVDAMAFDPKNDTLYADHDDGTEVWVINARTNKVIGTVTLPGAPEYLEYDPATDRLYQNVKTANCVVVINPATNKVEATWPTAPVTGPHGLAIDGKTHRLFSAGNGKVAMIDMRTGKVLATVGIGSGYVDQIAFDPDRNRLYCACGAGLVAVLEETPDGLTLRGSVPTPKGTHTLAVDPQTHAVWVSCTDAHGSSLMKLTP